MITPRMNSCPAPHTLRALERVAAGLWLERHRRDAAAALRQLDIDVGADDVEAVRGVVALQPNLETRAGFHANLRGREGESLGGDLDDPRVLSHVRATPRRTTAPAITIASASSLIELPIRTTIPGRR